MKRPVSSLAVGILFAACVQGQPLDADPRSIAAFDEATGAIEGTVHDQELRPLEGAVVGITALGATTTDANGAYRLSFIEPGTHAVLATAGERYTARTNKIEVYSGQATTVNFVLELLPFNGTYYEVFPYVGLEACQWYTPIGWAHCTWPYTAAYGGAAQNGVNLSSYSIPADLMENKQSYNYTVHPNSTMIVSELFWNAASAAAIYQRFYQACAWYDPVIDACWPPGETTYRLSFYAEGIGTSPITYRWQHNMTSDLPWVQSRASVFGDSQDRPIAFALSQKIDMYNTVFYGEIPPESFSAGPVDS